MDFLFVKMMLGSKLARYVGDDQQVIILILIRVN